MFVQVRPLRLIAVFSLVLVSTAGAQIHGVPASVSSFGFGGNFSSSPGVAASVTSLGPNGFGNSPAVFGNCCFPGFHFGGHSSGFSGRHHGPRTVFFPVQAYYPPYTQVIVVQPESAVYEDEASEDDVPLMHANRLARSHRVRQRIVEPEPEAEPQPAVAAPAAEPVVAQPSTVLVFQDGHRSEIQNYAIVGDTLFDLAGNRAHKIPLVDLDLPATQRANSDRGVDFQLPPAVR